MYDLIILGAGPGGTAGAVYAARKHLKTAIIAKEYVGQSVVSENIHNWIGTPEISGANLAKNLENHILYYNGPFLEVIRDEQVITIKKVGAMITISTDNNKNYEAKALLIATGSGRRKIEALNSVKYENKGIIYCASCDGPLYADMDVVVIGGGNSAFESAAQLLAYCKSVTLLHRNDTFKADEIIIQKLLENPKFKIIKNALITKFDGDKFLYSVTYNDKLTSEEHTIITSGAFVEIGQIPNTDFAKGILNLTEEGKVIVDPTSQTSSVEGIWAAGDCTNAKYHQNNIAAGDAVKALEDIYIWLQKNK